MNKITAIVTYSPTLKKFCGSFVGASGHYYQGDTIEELEQMLRGVVQTELAHKNEWYDEFVETIEFTDGPPSCSGQE